MNPNSEPGNSPVIRLVIVIEGGLVQNAVADVPIEVLVIDRDVGTAEVNPEVGMIRGALATVMPWTAVDLPEVVDEYLADATRAGLLP